MKHPTDAFIPYQERDHRQHEGAGKAGEIAELAGAEDETFVSGVSSSVEIGECGDDECACVGRHMQAIRDQRHRSPQQPTDDLRDHHRATQSDHGPTTPLISGVILAEKDVFVTPRIE